MKNSDWKRWLSVPFINCCSSFDLPNESTRIEKSSIPPHYSVLAAVSSGTRVWPHYYASLPSARNTMILLKVWDGPCAPFFTLQFHRVPFQMLHQLCSVSATAALVDGQPVQIKSDVWTHDDPPLPPHIGVNKGTFCRRNEGIRGERYLRLNHDHFLINGLCYYYY